MALYLNATFNSIDTLKKSIDIYEKENLINISIYKSELLKHPCSIELIKQFKYQRIFYVCKYSLKKRSRSTGLRKTSSFRKECTFNFKVIYKLDPIDGPHLVIVKFMEEHKNHDLNKNIYMLLPKQRKLSPIKKQIVEQALTFKANKVKIQDYILKTGQMVTLRDIHNLSANLNKPSTNMLIDVVNQLREDKDAIVEIHEENNELMGIFYQDIAMRHFVKCYPEVLFIDATYKLNNLGMPLFILMVIDGDGQSQIAALWLVKGETYKCVKTMCDIFGRYNIKDNIQVIIGDKDFADRQALYESFPKAEIHICIFHVMRSFKREITTGKRDIAEQDVKLVLDILQSLVYAKSQEHYDLLYLKLVNLNLPKVMAYYNNNWHNIKNEWVIGLRSGVPHFFNSTNNRVESMNQKFKAVITKFSTLKGLFKDVISIVNSMTFEKDYRSIMSYKKSSLFPYSLLSAESKYRNLLTTYAFKNILNEINLSNSISIPVLANNMFTAININDLGNIYNVSMDKCSCGYLTTMLLPCRHLMALRAAYNMDKYYPELCNVRWTRNYSKKCSLEQPQTYTTDISITSSVCMNTKKKLSQQQKYNKILKSFVSKAAYISNLPQDIFDFVFDQVEKMDDCFSDGKLFFLIPSDESIDIHSLINNPNDKDVLGDVVSVSSLEDNDEVHENIASVLLSPSLQNPEDIIINNEIEKTIFMPSCLQDDDLDQSNNIKISEALENLDMIIEREEQRKQDAIDDKENIDFEKIRSLKLPARMKRQGKPRKSDLTVIGLSKKGNKSKKKHFDIYNDKVKAIGIKSIPKFAEDIGKGTPIITNSQMEFINFIINEKINAGDTKLKNLSNHQITYKKLSKPYTTLSEENKARWIIDKICKEFAKNKIYNNEMVDFDDILTIKNSMQCLKNDEVDFQMIKSYLTNQAWIQVQNLQVKIMAESWICQKCYLSLDDDASIICDICLCWFHFKCQKIKKKPYKIHWFCNNCC